MATVLVIVSAPDSISFASSGLGRMDCGCILALVHMLFMNQYHHRISLDFTGTPLPAGQSRTRAKQQGMKDQQIIILIIIDLKICLTESSQLPSENTRNFLETFQEIVKTNSN